MTEFWRWPRMCPLCFEQKPLEELYVDPSGQRWDTCYQCQVDDAYAWHHRYPDQEYP